MNPHSPSPNAQSLTAFANARYQVVRKLDDARILALCEAIRLGATRRLACEMTGISQSYLTEMEHKFPLIAQATRQAMADRACELLTIFNHAMETKPELAATMLARLYPEDYGKKSTLNHTGQVDVQHSQKPPLDFSKLSREEIITLQAIYDKAALEDNDDAEPDDYDGDTFQSDPDDQGAPADGAGDGGPRLLHP